MIVEIHGGAITLNLVWAWDHEYRVLSLTCVQVFHRTTPAYQRGQLLVSNVCNVYYYSVISYKVSID